MSLVDLLSGMVVFHTLSLSLNDWLNLFNDVFVDVLSDDGSIDRGRVSLITNDLLVLEGTLGTVLGGVVLGDILSYVTLDLGSDVLVVSVDLLLVDDGLDFLVDFLEGERRKRCFSICILYARYQLRGDSRSPLVDG